jgi:hypothetical protein
VGYSGYGKLHGLEGFKAFSNSKSILTKPALKMFPYNMTYPPYTPSRQQFVRYMIAAINYSQMQAFKGLIGIVIAIFLIRAMVKGELNLDTLHRIKDSIV